MRAAGIDNLNADTMPAFLKTLDEQVPMGIRDAYIDIMSNMPQAVGMMFPMIMGLLDKCLKAADKWKPEGYQDPNQLTLPGANHD